MLDFFNSFGFKKVTAEEKTLLIKEVFDSVASKYDLMNDLMSLGVHRWWKNNLAQEVTPYPDMEILDMAGGTGDMGFRFLESFQDKPLCPSVTICDINPTMMTVGKERSLNKGITKGLRWVCGNASSLPFPSQSMDVYTIAFGLRNVTDIPGALAEARRVLKPQGRFFCLEFSKVTLPPLKKAYELYLLQCLPKLGQWVAQDAPSYQYLAESIIQFPTQEELVALLSHAGFTQVSYENYTGGVVALHKARGGS